MENNKKKYLMIGLRILPIVIIIASLYFYNKYNDLFAVESIFEFTPNNLWLAALFFLAMYILKPVTIIVPVVVLQVSCAMFFPPTEALLINTVGAALAVAIAYVLGSFLGQNKVQKIFKKLKKKKSISDLTEEGQFFYVFLIRLIGIISMDVTGLILGSTKMNFIKYFTASMLGLMPAIVIGTFIGTTLSDPTSAGFLLSLSLKGVLVIMSIVIYRKKFNKKAQIATDEQIDNK